jgi:hypothetical protein
MAKLSPAYPVGLQQAFRETENPIHLEAS